MLSVSWRRTLELEWLRVGPFPILEELYLLKDGFAGLIDSLLMDFADFPAAISSPFIMVISLFMLSS